MCAVGLPNEFWFARDAKYESILRKFLEKGADVNIRNQITGDTPLQLAVKNRNISITNILLEKGADVNIRNHLTGDTPLHVAVADGFTYRIVFLLEKGAEINLENNENKLPLDTAIQNGNGKHRIDPKNISSF